MNKFAPHIFIGFLLLSIFGVLKFSDYQLNRILKSEEIKDLDTKMKNTDWQSCYINLEDYNLSILDVWKIYQYDYNMGRFPKADYIEYYLSTHEKALTKGDKNNLNLFIQDCNNQINKKKINLRNIEIQKSIFK